MGLVDWLTGLFSAPPLDEASIVTAIRDARWRQGAILRNPLAARVSRQLKLKLRDDEKLVVVTHDCDVVNGRLEHEPFVELLRIKPAAANGNATYGKNPRRLEFSVDVQGVAQQFEAVVHDRVRMARSVLASGQPDTTVIADDTRDLISEWLAKRYVRAAFPDAFNDRIAGQKKAIEKALKKDGEYLSGIYLVLSSMEELSEDELYTIAITGTMRVADYDDQARRVAADRALTALSAAVRAARGIIVEAVSLQSEDEFTLDDARIMLRWDYDALSWRHGGEMPPPVG